MGKKNDLTSEDKANITRRLAAGENTLQIAHNINRDHRTIKAFTANSDKRRTRSDKGIHRCVTRHDLTALKRSTSRKPLSSSKSIFNDAGVTLPSRPTRCRVLKKFAKVKSAVKQPPLKKIHKQKRIEWAKRYMKIDFNQVVFTDECRATLDGPDGFSRGWITRGTSPPIRLRRQQGGGESCFGRPYMDEIWLDHSEWAME